MVQLLLLFWRHASESVLFWGSISQVSTSWALLAWEVVLEKMHDALQPTLDALALAERASVGLDLPLRDSPDYSIRPLVMWTVILKSRIAFHTHKSLGRNKV
jgi:hypothetical protein